MHPYSTDSGERKTVYFILSILSAIAAWGIHELVDQSKLVPPWWLEIPSIFGFYGLFLGIFNRWLWRTKFVRSVGLVKVPRFDGKWRGTVVSSYEGIERKRDAAIQIFQTWTSIKINLETETSKSRSRSASVITRDPGITIAVYEYLNEPKPNSVETMQIHRGTARQSLTIVEGEEVFAGDYYSGRGRGTIGSLMFRRESG